jgi:hypothetical protein
MEGPASKGTWSRTSQPQRYGMLEPDQRYTVVREFTDFDGMLHPPGEIWRFLTYSFLPYDDGLSLFVSLDDKCEWHIRLQDRAEQQGAIVSNLATYLAPLPEEDTLLTTRSLNLGLGRLTFSGTIGISAALLAALQEFFAHGPTPRTALIVAAVGLVAAVVAYAAWPLRRERTARRLIEPNMSEKKVRLLLGEPEEALELFPGPIATRWIYSPTTIIDRKPIGIRLAIDFDFSDRVMRVQRI